jgi:hypothetical protein
MKFFENLLNYIKYHRYISVLNKIQVQIQNGLLISENKPGYYIIELSKKEMKKLVYMNIYILSSDKLSEEGDRLISNIVGRSLVPIYEWEDGMDNLKQSLLTHFT